MPSIKGTASVTDNRALNKRLGSVKFPSNFTQKLDVESVNRAVMTQWIEQKITDMLGLEDEIVQSTAVNLFLPTRLEDGPKVEVNPKKAQIDLEGFLGEEKAAEFAAEVWELLLDAQSSGVGVPKKLVEEKKKELEAQKAQASASSRQQHHHQNYPPGRDFYQDDRRRGPPPPGNYNHHYYYNNNNPQNRGPSPPRGPRRSVSPERRPGGGRDEFGRSTRPDAPYGRDDRAGGRRPTPPNEMDRRGPPRDYGGRRYDRRPSPPPYRRDDERRHHHHHHHRHGRDDRYRYDDPDEAEDAGAPRGGASGGRPPARRRSRSRSRSPPPSSRRSRRHRSRSASSSSASSSQSSASARSSDSGRHRGRGSR